MPKDDFSGLELDIQILLAKYYRRCVEKGLDFDEQISDLLCGIKEANPVD